MISKSHRDLYSFRMYEAILERALRRRLHSFVAIKNYNFDKPIVKKNEDRNFIGDINIISYLIKYEIQHN